MKQKINLDEVREFIMNSSPESIIYIGTDSERYRMGGKWFADYASCAVIHIDGCHGCKVFGDITTEQDFDQKKDKPRMRLMTEVMKAAQLYLDLAESIGDRHAEIHLDVNPNIMYGSSCVINEAVGYIKGMTNIIPMVKPNSPAASFCADRLSHIISHKVA